MKFYLAAAASLRHEARGKKTLDTRFLATLTSELAMVWQNGSLLSGICRKTLTLRLLR